MEKQEFVQGLVARVLSMAGDTWKDGTSASPVVLGHQAERLYDVLTAKGTRIDQGVADSIYDFCLLSYTTLLTERKVDQICNQHIVPRSIK